MSMRIYVGNTNPHIYKEIDINDKEIRKDLSVEVSLRGTYTLPVSFIQDVKLSVPDDYKGSVQEYVLKLHKEDKLGIRCPIRPSSGRVDGKVIVRDEEIMQMEATWTGEKNITGDKVFFSKDEEEVA